MRLDRGRVRRFVARGVCDGVAERPAYRACGRPERRVPRLRRTRRAARPGLRPDGHRRGGPGPGHRRGTAAPLPGRPARRRGGGGRDRVGRTGAVLLAGGRRAAGPGVLGLREDGRVTAISGFESLVGGTATPFSAREPYLLYPQDGEC